MKDIKSMIIGFLLATCMFLFIGATSNEIKIGRYQAWSDSNYNSKMIDTKTGQIYDLGNNNYKFHDSNPYYWIETSRLNDILIKHNMPAHLAPLLKNSDK